MTSQAETSDLTSFTVTVNGVEMGTYPGEDEDAALDAYARDAGYPNYAALVEDHPAKPDDWGVHVADADAGSALTTATVTDALDDEGYTKVHRRSVLDNLRLQDKDYSCCYWVEVDGQVGITTEAGRFIDAGDDGEGWVIDDEPVDSIEELLAVLRVA